MKRSFLKELGLESDVIDRIMAENGKDIEKYKSDIEDYVSEIKDLKAGKVDVSKEIEKAIKKKEEEYKERFAKEYVKNVEKFFEGNGIDFTSSLAKEAILNKFKEKDFKLKEGKFGEDAINFMKELKESNKDAFKEIENNNANNTYTYTPKGGNSSGGKVESLGERLAKQSIESNTNNHNYFGGAN